MSLQNASVSARKLAALRWEVANIQNFLDEFEAPAHGGRRLALLGDTAEYLILRNFPLPDRYQPDCLDALMLTDGFPALPPIGLYVLNRQNPRLIAQLEGRFNAFPDRAFHDAPAISGYTWICYHYAGNCWRYRANDPARGDNLRKFLASFFAELN